MWLRHAKLYPSFVFKLLTLLMILATLFVTYWIEIPISLRCLLVAITLWYGYLIYMQEPASRVSSLDRLRPGEWMLTMRHEKWVGRLRGDSLMTPWLMVLRFKVVHQRRPLSLVLFKDTLTPEVFRRLLVTIKLDR